LPLGGSTAKTLNFCHVMRARNETGNLKRDLQPNCIPKVSEEVQTYRELTKLTN
jgi:hypothetical protein